jgi:hypothetical protein
MISWPERRRAVTTISKPLLPPSALASSTAIRLLAEVDQHPLALQAVEPENAVGADVGRVPAAGKEWRR